MKSPLWRQIAADLEGAIERGDYAPGDALPTALELSERLGVHRHTVRQAFRFLAEEGRVSVEQGRGTFVTNHRIPYRVGRQVSFRSNFAASGLSTKMTILECTQVMGDSAPQLPCDPDARLWCIRTLGEAGGKPVSISTHYLLVARFADFPERLAQAGGSISAAFSAYGIARYERLETRIHAGAASEIEARLLNIAAASPVLHTSGLDGTDNGEALQMVASTFVGDAIEIVIAGH